MKKLWDMFLAFARIGGLTFGGGYAMLPMLQREVVEKHHWATEEELADYYAIGQCTPGVIAVNTATFIGYRQAGIIGGIFATLVHVTEFPKDPAGAFNWFGIVLAAALYAAIKKWNRHPVIYIAASAAVGIAAGYLHMFG